MAWQKLADRINSLPLVLCGPLVRRVDSTSTTIWIALKEPRKVTLRVYQMASDLSGRVQVQEGTHSTVKLGLLLHVVAVTAVGNMKWGSLFVYDLRFGSAGNDAVPVPEDATGLFNSNILAETESDARKLILYEANEIGPNMAPLDLPSFATPPTDLNQLRLIHGSCRKPHGFSQDALQILDSLIRSSLSDPLHRPHQLFLTGDQIYADDVADGLLAMLTDAGDTVLGWPAPEMLLTKDGPKKAADLMPGRRLGTIHEKEGGPLSSNEGKSHLLSLGEFYAMYLFAWSAVLWPIKPPEFADLYQQEWEENQADASQGEEEKSRRHQKTFVKYKAELERLGTFKVTLRLVRRALANIPSYMIFDDHEISDDWYVDQEWCANALSKPLGRQVIGNGLLAYAVFQAWGNTPEKFDAQDKPGWELLKAASQWDGTPTNETHLNEIHNRVGLNEAIDVRTNKKLTHSPGALDWHYRLPSVSGGPPYEVIVLDSRTWRGYPGGPMDAPALISDEIILDRQLAPGIPAPTDGLTVVIAPAPVIGVPLVEELVQTDLPKLTFNTSPVSSRSTDREAWGHQRHIFELLLGRLVERSSRIVFLSGDVHYGFSARLSYWAQRPYGSPPPSMSILHRSTMAQLTSSALKNESNWPPTRLMHQLGYAANGLRARKLLFGGWPGRVPIIRAIGRYFLHSKPALANLDDPTIKVSVLPDWRYRIDYLLAEPRAATPASIPRPLAWDLKPYLECEKAYSQYMKEYAPGKEIVGLNNLGEVIFSWNAGDDRTVTHQLWWQLTSSAQAFPLSKYVISLRLNDQKYPEPPLPELTQ